MCWVHDAEGPPELGSGKGKQILQEEGVRSEEPSRLALVKTIQSCGHEKILHFDDPASIQGVIPVSTLPHTFFFKGSKD